MNRFVVERAYAAAYADPICFDAGDPVEVQRADAEFPGWYWCRSQAGKEGWVHHAFLYGSSGMTHALRSYSARELTAQVGQQGTVLEHLGGWLHVQLDGGDIGWLPETHAARISR